MNKHISGPFRSLKQLILASGSPRRKELMGGLGLLFDVHPSVLDEPGPRYEEAPADYAQRMATMKTHEVAARFPEAATLGADTIVVLNDRIMGKPSNESEALSMLKALSGNTHQVISAFCLILPDGEAITQAISTDVDMRISTERELLNYIATGEPMDKAGAYAIQGIGAFMVKGIRGSYTNVVGLPLVEVMDTLSQQGIIETEQE